MFGTPVVATDESATFHLEWTYVIKELDGCKKAAVHNTALHDQVRYEYLITPMQILSSAQALACSMQSWQPRTCQSMGPTHPTLLQKHRHQSRVSIFTPTELSKIGGSIAKRTLPIPDGHMILVLRALQCHPESPCLWEKHVDKILCSIGFTPTVHKPCIYSGTILNKRILFMQQVDDFAISKPSECIIDHILDLINNLLFVPIKCQGFLTL
jgi:hypothetical protein